MSEVKITQKGMTDYSRSFERRPVSARAAFPLAVLVGVLPGVLGTAFVAVIAHAAGVSNDFAPLKASAYVGLIVLGVLAGGVGWQLVRSRSRNPRALLRRLVPFVLTASFIPDIAIGVTGADHATWGGVVALMCAHVVVAGAAVTSFSYFLRPSSRASA
jgi:hypothetical protein